MADMTFDEVLYLAEQLTPEEQKALIARLEAEVRQREAEQNFSTQEDFNRTFDLLVFDASPSLLNLLYVGRMNMDSVWDGVDK